MKQYIKPFLKQSFMEIENILLISMDDGIFDLDDNEGGFDEVWK